ncbi:MAG: type II secretion system F family protein [Candidatus Nanopelagicales bacterium]
MGALVGVMFGCGLLSIWLAVSSSHERSSVSESEADSGRRVGDSHDTRRSGILSRRNQLAIASGLGFGIVIYIFSGLAIVGVLAAVLGSFIPLMLARRAQHRETHRRREAWPDVIDGLVSAVRAGMSLPEAVAAVGDRGPAVVRPVFAQFAADYRATGRFGESLTRLRDELQDPVADRIVEALLAARDVGGSDLGRMLRTLSDFVRQDLRLRGEAEARRSWTVNGARLAIAAPWIVLLLLSTRPDAAAAYQTPTGMVVILGCAAACTVAYALMSKIGRLPDEQRVML